MMLYVYSHCPYCARVTWLLHAKHVGEDTVKLVVVSYDDEETVKALHPEGKKLLPLLDTRKPAVGVVAESADIITFLDGEVGGPRLLRPQGEADAEAAAALEKWFEEVFLLTFLLQVPRWWKQAKKYEELATETAASYFRSRKEGMLRAEAEANIAEGYEPGPQSLEECLACTPELMPELAELLEEMDTQLSSEHAVLPGGGPTLCDVKLWAELDALAIVEELVLPPRLKVFFDYFHAFSSSV